MDSGSQSTRTLPTGFAAIFAASFPWESAPRLCGLADMPDIPGVADEGDRGEAERIADRNEKRALLLAGWAG